MRLYRLVIPGVEKGLYIRADDSHEVSRILNAVNASTPVFTTESRGLDATNFTKPDTWAIIRQCTAAIEIGECG